MVKIPDKVKFIIDRYIQMLESNNVPVKQVYLFGSYAKGTFQELSDIDIAIISEIFEGKRLIDKGKIRKITLAVSSDLEVFPFNPQDFNIDNPFAREIIETGIKII